MSRELKDTFLIAAHDYRDAFRSRRLIVWLLIYLCIAIGATLIFTQILREAEKQIAKVIAVDTTEKAGNVATTIQQTKVFKNMVREMVDDKDLAEELLTLSPLVMFYAWFSFTFLPLLVIILCSETIAKEIQSRYVRFHLFRTSRAAYAVGKAMSAASILLVALALSGIAVLIIGVFRIHRFDFIATFPGMMIFMVKCWIYSLAFLGLALMASQLRKSPLQALLLALVCFMSLAILGGIATFQSGPGLARLWEIAKLLSPGSHAMGLWHPNLVPNLKSAAYCAGLGIFYFSLGFTVFSRRDL